MKIPIVCLRSCSANVCPHTFGKEGVFQLNSKYQVGSSRRIYIAPFLSQSNKTLPNTCFASEPYSLIHGLSGNFPVRLIS